MKFLVVGLGNPGRQYAATRHNVGWLAVDLLRERIAGEAWRTVGNVETVETSVGKEKVVLAKPQTFMNCSGDAVAPLAKKHGVTPDHVIIIQDDKDMPVGKLRIRLGGSAGGHNGVKSVIERLGTPEFLRVKIGVGSPATGEDTADFVLATFLPEEKPTIKDAVARAADAVISIIEEGLDATMNRFN
jgi:PTH1 family peptidyl-tRNA hydrolase